MEEQTKGAISAIAERPPLYWEAVAYCEEYGLPREDVERARVMLAVRELKRRTEPYHRHAAMLMATQPVNLILSGDGYVRADLSRETDAALKKIQEMCDAEAARLGISVTRT